MLVNTERTHTSAPQPSVDMHGEDKTEGEEGRTKDTRRHERTRREGARRRKGGGEGRTIDKKTERTGGEETRE